jgi:hypothetical protein
MEYDLSQVPQLLADLHARGLTKKECGLARELINRYYAKKLAGLQRALFELLEQRRSELSPFDIDEYIHRYHKQSQELYIFINHRSHSNDNLRFWLTIIDNDEKGEAVWESQTNLEP